MKQLLHNIVRISGWLVGMLLSLFTMRGRIFYWLYLFRRYCVTALYSRRFKHFGSRSMLGTDMLLVHPENISIGKWSSVMNHCVLEVCTPDGALQIGDGVSVGEYSHITAGKSVVIGNNVLTGRFILITDNSHGQNRSAAELETPPLGRAVIAGKEVVVEDNVWIGERVVILPGVHIGRGSVIGANSVVTKDLPAFSIAAGNPCKIIRQYFL